jgi:copper(I)-binding protein
MKKLITLFLMTSNLAFAYAVKVSNAEIRLVPPVSKTTAMFLTLKNTTDKNIKLVKIKSEISDNIELHEMKMENNSMQMRSLDSIEISKKAEVKLESGGLHVMIFNLKRALHEKDKHKFTLTFDNNENVDIEAIVKNFN